MPDAQRRARGAHDEQQAESDHPQQHAQREHEQHAQGEHEQHTQREHEQHTQGEHAQRTSSGEPGSAVAAAKDWSAPAATGPVRAVVALPGSKSITNRALVLAALADGPGLIRRPLRARDTLLMAAALRALGVRIEELQVTVAGEPVPCWRVTPSPKGAPESRHLGAPTGPQATDVLTAAHSAGAPQARHTANYDAGGAGGCVVDVGNAGTVLRFVPPVATLVLGDVAFDGDARARERPTRPLIAALRELGAVIDDGGRGALPFTVHGRGGMPGGAVTLDASGSSQLVSALLLAGARFDMGVEVHHQGPPVPSSPHIAMTIAMLLDAGVRVEAAGRDSWWVHPGPLRARTVDVEPDLSNAAPFLAAALVTGGTVIIPGWPARTTQPGDVLRDLLTRMGGSCVVAADGLTVRGSGAIHGINADLRDVSELVPVLTALAALASSPSRFTGIAHMRSHETDRLAALAREINALGGHVTELPDGLAITPRPLHAARAGTLPGPATPTGPTTPAAGTTASSKGSTSGAWAGRAFATYDDHRLVMAAAVLGLAVPGLHVADAATVAKTLPGFTQLWTEMLERTP